MQKLDQSVSKQLSSAQVVISAEAVIKELVENSLDAGASSIEIKVANGGALSIVLYYPGLESISCKDNGQGITHDDALIACQRYTTSKIKTFDDLE
jgi:DNA mismatch repair ATPase MutL